SDLTGMVRTIEEHRGLGERELGLLELQAVVQVAIVGSADASEDHVPLVRCEVVGKSQSRLELAGVGRAIVAVAHVVVRADAAFGQALSVGLSRSARGRVRLSR